MLLETPKPHLCPLNPPYIHTYNNLKELQHLSTVPMQSGIISTKDSLLCSLNQHSWNKQLTPHFKPEAPVAAVSQCLLTQQVLNVPAWGQSQQDLCRIQAPPSCGSRTVRHCWHSIGHCLILLSCSHSFSSHCPWIPKETRITSTGGFGGSFYNSLCSCYMLALPT